MVRLDRDNADKLGLARRSCVALPPRSWREIAAIFDLATTVAGVANSRIWADAFLDAIEAMRPGSIVLGFVVTLIGGGMGWAGGLGDDQGEGNDTIFFGTVKDMRGVAIAGARVNVKFKSMSFVTTTDVIGNYRLSTTIDPDQSEVSCSKEGYRQSGTTQRSASGGPKAPVEVDCILQRGP